MSEKFDEDDIANRLLDELFDNGYKSLRDMEWQKSFERAEREYERRLANPYDM